MDIMCVGEMVVDFLPGREPGSYVRHAGGAPANVAIAAARLGVSSGFCGKVGDDDFGRFLQNTLRDENVRILCPAPVSGIVTTMAFVTLQPDGERSFTFARRPGADMFLQRRDIEKKDIKECSILHAGSCSLSKGSAAAATLHAMKAAQKAGKLVGFDINYRALMWDGGQAAALKKVHKALPMVDLLKLSEEELWMLGGETQVPDFLRRYGICVIVETMGTKGAKAWLNGRCLYSPPIEVSQVDTTGAGDAFWGAFLSSLILEDVRTKAVINAEAVQRAMDMGNAAGALCVQKMGAIHSLPTRQALLAYISEGKGSA